MAHRLPAPEPAAAPAAAAPPVVLDTNVALDWLVFDDASTAALARQVRAGALRWIACARMRAELADVLARPIFASRTANVEQALTFFDRLAAPVELAAAAPAPASLRCSDPDDQVFIDLALAQGARWLFTRDKALLALAAAAARRGLAIVRPAAWAAAPA